MNMNADGYIHFKIDELNLYRKNRVEVHYLESLDIAGEGTEIVIPTLEGDVKVNSSRERYIMIGPCNDIYPIRRELFEKRYDVLPDEPVSIDAGVITGLGWNLDCVKKCRLKNDVFIYAREVPTAFKVHVKHSDSDIYGEAGDYYVVSCEDTENAYIIDREVMRKTYTLVK